MDNQIFDSLFQIVNFFNDPKRDSNLLREAGIKEDRNLLPVIVRVGMRQTISVGELADQLGKNHSSTSRQIDKFEKQGLLMTRYNDQDKRIREIMLTPSGEKLYHKITETRQALFADFFKQLPPEQLAQIEQSLRLITAGLNNLQ